MKTDLLVAIGFILFAVIAIYTWYCSKDTFTIRKGQHRSGYRFVPVFNPKFMIRSVTFLPDCLYSMPNNMEDTNKLFGFSRGWHHSNSARIGWRQDPGDPGMIQLLGYVYSGGVRINEQYICSVDPGENFQAHIKAMNLAKQKSGPRKVTYEFAVFRDSQAPRYVYLSDCNKGFPLGIKLFPYFGGTRPAPHNMTIYMSKLNLKFENRSI